MNSINLAGVGDRSSRDPLAPKNQNRTPRPLFEKYDSEYHFTLDAAASHENALCDQYCTVDGYFRSGEQAIYEGGLDGVSIARIWRRADGPVWCNPPYGTGLVEPFVREWAKAYLDRGVTSVFLIPARVEQPWFHDWVLPYARIDWLRGRVAFDDWEGKPQASAGFPCLVARFDR